MKQKRKDKKQRKEIQIQTYK